MSEDIVERLRVAQELGGLVQPGPAADEIERLRAEVEALKQGQEVCANAMNMGADVIDGLKANLTEALRLMEPVAEAWNRNPLTPGTSWVGGVCAEDGEAIFDFVTRMRGE